MVDYKWNALSTSGDGRTSRDAVREECITAKKLKDIEDFRTDRKEMDALRRKPWTLHMPSRQK